MGSIRIKKDGRIVRLDENATGAQLKQELKLPRDSVLVNAKNQVIGNNDRIGNKVRDSEEVAAYPSFKYW